MNIDDLMELWARVLTEPIPDVKQFRLWLEQRHPSELRLAILRCARKSLALEESLSLADAVAFVDEELGAKETE